MNHTTALLGNSVAIPRELIDEIGAYANIRVHKNKVSTKFHPHDHRLQIINFMLERNLKQTHVYSNCISVILRNWLCIKKYHHTNHEHYEYNVIKIPSYVSHTSYTPGVYSYPYPY